jgi:hypothetical protein
LLQSRKFEWQVRALREDTEAGVAYGLTQRVDVESGRSRIWARTGEDIESLFPDFLIRRGWDTNSPLWRRSTCDVIGDWGEFRCLEDWEHDLRAGMLGVKVVRVHQHVATVRDHGEIRASGMNGGFTPNLTREMFKAHRAVWFEMRARGLVDWAYLGEFSRKLFWIARVCGECGLMPEADEALDMADEMVSTEQLPVEIWSFRALTRILGWSRAVAFSEWLRRHLGRGEAETIERILP